MVWLLMGASLGLAQAQQAPFWPERDPAASVEPDLYRLRRQARTDADALEYLSILEPRGDWREFAKSLLAQDGFKRKVSVAAILARSGDFSGWVDAREELLFRLATTGRDGSTSIPKEVIYALAAFWKMTTATDPQAGAALRELERMSMDLEKSDRTIVLNRLAEFDPQGWIRQGWVRR